MDDCWNRIGVRGDGSCPELTTHKHCRNCPVHATAASSLLNIPPPPGYLDEQTAHFAAAQTPDDEATDSLMLFRVGQEWLALPTPVVTEIATLRPVHSLPHRRSSAVLGIVNIRGELIVCASLGAVLGFDRAATEAGRETGTAYTRLLVIRRDGVRAVCPVDEVHGVRRPHRRDLKDVPATLAKSPGRFSTKLLSWGRHSVAVLDADRVFMSLKRSLA